MNDTKELEVQWQNSTRKLLVGKTVRHVRYMNDKEMEDFMWYKKTNSNNLYRWDYASSSIR